MARKSLEDVKGLQYKINRGDTLTAIAKRYNTTVDVLAKANNIANPDLIYAGNSLTIPGAMPKPNVYVAGRHITPVGKVQTDEQRRTSLRNYVKSQRGKYKLF